MLTENPAEGEDVDDEQQGAKHGTLRDTVSDCGSGGGTVVD